MNQLIERMAKAMHTRQELAFSGFEGYTSPTWEQLDSSEREGWIDLAKAAFESFLEWYNDETLKNATRYLEWKTLERSYLDRANF